LNCQKYNLSIIEEELESHICRKAKKFYIKGDILWLSDGITEIPLKLSTIKNDIKSGKIYQPQSNRENNYRRGNST